MSKIKSLFLLVSCCVGVFAAAKDIIPDNEPFILGIYSGLPQYYEMLSGIGINYVQDYYQSRAKLENPLSVLDDAEKYKLKVLLDIGSGRHILYGKPSKEEIMKEVEAAKNHPALGMWYTADEPRTDWLPKVREFNDSIKAVSDIPTALVIQWRDKWYDTRGYSDVWMVDMYPVRGQAFPHAPLNNYTNLTARAAKIKSPGTPLVPVIQAQSFRCFPHLVKEENRATVRYPNDIEMRFMGFSSLTYGVRGLFFFSLRHCHLDRADGKAFFDKVFVPFISEVKEFTGEVSKVWDVTFWDYDFNKSEEVNLGYWARGEGNYLVLTNDKPEVRELKLKLKGYPAIPGSGKLVPRGQTAAGKGVLANHVLTVKNVQPWETFIWKIE